MSVVLKNAFAFPSWVAAQVETGINRTYNGIKTNVLPTLTEATHTVAAKMKNAWDTVAQPLANPQQANELNQIEQAPPEAKENRNLYQKTVKTINKDVIRHSRVSDVVLTASGVVSGVALVTLLGIEAVPLGVMLGLTITGIAIACIFHRRNTHRDKKLYDYLEDLKTPIETKDYNAAIDKWGPIQKGWTINRREDDRHVAPLKDIYDSLNKLRYSKEQAPDSNKSVIIKIENLQKLLSQFTDRERALRNSQKNPAPTIKAPQTLPIKQEQPAHVQNVSPESQSAPGPIIEEMEDEVDISFEADIIHDSEEANHPISNEHPKIGENLTIHVEKRNALAE